MATCFCERTNRASYVTINLLDSIGARAKYALCEKCLKFITGLGTKGPIIGLHTLDAPLHQFFTVLVARVVHCVTAAPLGNVFCIPYLLFMHLLPYSVPATREQVRSHCLTEALTGCPVPAQATVVV